MFMIFLDHFKGEDHFKGQEPIPTATGRMWFLSMLGIYPRTFCFSADHLQSYTLSQSNNAVLQKAILQMTLQNSFSFQSHDKTLTLYLHLFPLDPIEPNDPSISVKCHSNASNLNSKSVNLDSADTAKTFPDLNMRLRENWPKMSVGHWQQWLWALTSKSLSGIPTNASSRCSLALWPLNWKKWYVTSTRLLNFQLY